MTPTEIISLAREVKAASILLNRALAKLDTLSGSPVHMNDRATAGRIIQIVAEQTGVSAKAMVARNRTQAVVDARWVAMGLIRSSTKLSSTEVGEMFGRDHGSVLHAIASMADAIQYRPKFDARYNQLAAVVKERIGVA